MVLGFNAFVSAASGRSCGQDIVRTGTHSAGGLHQPGRRLACPLGRPASENSPSRETWKDDELEVNDEQPDRKGREEPYD
jgi:hypothetical protein